MKTILTLAAAAVAFAASPAAAQQFVPVNGQLIVSYSDLDLSTRSGVRKLDRRIRSAVQIACGEASDSDLAGQNAVRACRADTLAQARAQRETAIAEARAPRPTQLASGR